MGRIVFSAVLVVAVLLAWQPTPAFPKPATAPARRQLVRHARDAEARNDDSQDGQDSQEAVERLALALGSELARQAARSDGDYRAYGDEEDEDAALEFVDDGARTALSRKRSPFFGSFLGPLLVRAGAGWVARKIRGRRGRG